MANATQDFYSLAGHRESAVTAEAAASAAPSTVTLGGVPRPRVSVLVIDDDPSARHAIVAILKRLAFDVAEAGSIAEALRQVDEQPDWVLLDLMLPDGCGTEVLRRVAAKGGSRVCVITGAGPALTDQARSLGPRHVLRKPLDLARLLSILST